MVAFTSEPMIPNQRLYHIKMSAGSRQHDTLFHVDTGHVRIRVSTEAKTFPANIEMKSSSGRRFEAVTIGDRLKNRLAFYNTILLR